MESLEETVDKSGILGKLSGRVYEESLERFKKNTEIVSRVLSGRMKYSQTNSQGDSRWNIRIKYWRNPFESIWRNLRGNSRRNHLMSSWKNSGRNLPRNSWRIRWIHNIRAVYLADYRKNHWRNDEWRNDSWQCHLARRFLILLNNPYYDCRHRQQSRLPLRQYEICLMFICIPSFTWLQ